MQNPLLKNDRPLSKAKLWVIAILLLAAAGLTFLLDWYSSRRPDQNLNQNQTLNQSQDHPLLVIHHGADSTVVDIDGWDSLKIDSFIKADLNHRANYDTLTEPVDVDQLDSLIHVPSLEKAKNPKP